MYWRHFNLTAEPFSLTPDPSFLYLSPVHAEAYAALMMGLRERRGLTTMIGEVGTGKTTLVYSVLSGLGPEIHTAYVSNARLSFDGILRVALRDFGVPCDSAHSSELTDAFNAFLLDCANKGTTAALVIDEAQNLSFETFEDLRLLTNFETYTHKLLQIVLVGQPELDTKLRDPALRQVSERVAVRCVVNPLPRRESRAYLEHRLAAVNGSLDIFTSAALRLLIARSRGIPRSLNILAHNAMLFSYGEAADRVSRRFVAAAVKEKEGRGLVRLWRRPQQQRDPAKRGWRSSFWTLSAAAACGIVVGLAIAGGETLFGKLSTPPTRAATSITGQEPVLSVEAEEAVVPTPAPEPHVETEAPEAAEIVPQEFPVAVEASIAAEAPAEAPPTIEPVAAAPTPAAAVEPPAQIAAAVVAPAVAAPPAEVPAEVVAPAVVAPPAEVAAATITPPEQPAAPPPQPTQQTQTPAARPSPAPASRPAARAPAERPAPSLRTVASAPAPQDNTAAQDRARVITVPPGSSLSGLLLTVYGQYSSEMLARVKAVNPQVNDPDFIIAGDELRFPAVSQGQSTQPAGGQTR